MKPTHCRACGAPLTRTFVDLGMSPLANSYIPMDRADEAEKFYPLHAKICEVCFLVQLESFEAPSHIFSDSYAYFSSFSDTWLQHARAYADDMVARFGLGADAHITEVASNDGYLLRWFLERGLRVTGIEPAANCAAAAEALGVTTEVLFFTTGTARDIAGRRGQADLIAANNVLAHVPDIQDFVGGFREMLKPEGVATFEFPHLLNLIALNQFDTIYHEHFSYLALHSVRRVLESQGLRVFDVQELPTHGGSLRVFACHREASYAETEAVAALLGREVAAGLTDLAIYDAYTARVVEVKEKTWEFLIGARRGGKLVCGYGAPAKGNTFLNYCGIGRDHLAFTVDRNPAKQNTLLPGTRIPVLPVQEISRRRPDYVLILPWNLTTEVSQSIANIRDWGGRFVIAIPNLEIF